MTTIPPTAAPPLPAAAPAASALTVVLQQPPAQLLQLPPGATVETVVLRVQQQPPQAAAPPQAPSPQAAPPQTPPTSPDKPAADAAQQAAQRASQQAADQADVRKADARLAETRLAEARLADARLAETRQATVTLRTPAGDVTVRTPLPLNDGAKVALEIVRSSATQITARVVTIDGQAAQQVLAQAARQTAQQTAQATAQPPPLPDKPAAPLPNPTQTAPLQPGQAWTPQGPAPLVAITPLSAFVLTASAAPLPQTPLQQAITQAFQPGTDLGIRVISVQLPNAPAPLPGAQVPAAGVLPTPGGPITPQVTAALNAAITPQAGASPATPQPTGATPTTPFSPQPQTPAQNTAPTPAPTTPTPTAATALPGPAPEPQGLRLPGPQGFGAFTPSPPGTVEAAAPLFRINGVITSTTGTGAVIVQTDAGQMQLNVRSNLPAGSTLILDVMATAPPRTAPGGGIILAGPIPSFAGLPLSTPTMGWGSLSESLQLLQRTDPQAATQLANAIPDGGPRTAVAAMAFIQAMRTGDARQWPGDSALRGLERNGPRGAQLAAQISGEVSELARRAGDTSSEWRTLPVPWNAEGQIERIAMIMRREGAGDDDDDKKKSSKGKGTRFLINLDLSRLGEMQLDGMFNKGQRAFDMMIRTKQTLPDHMRRDLTGLFANSNAAMGLKGGLAFQVVKKFPDPTATGPAADRGGLWA